MWTIPCDFSCSEPFGFYVHQSINAQPNTRSEQCAALLGNQMPGTQAKCLLIYPSLLPLFARSVSASKGNMKRHQSERDRNVLRPITYSSRAEKVYASCRFYPKSVLNWLCSRFSILTITKSRLLYSNHTNIHIVFSIHHGLWCK